MSGPDNERELYAAVGLGIDAEKFFDTDVGRYILRRSNDDRQDALADLVDTPASDAERIRQLQSDIKRADSIVLWVNEAIEAGKNAEAALTQGE